MVLSRHFLNSTVLFSSITPDFKKYLWDELTSCEKYVGIDYNTLMKMPTYIRKFHIAKHNDVIKEEREKMNKSKKNNKR